MKFRKNKCMQLIHAAVQFLSAIFSRQFITVVNGSVVKRHATASFPPFCSTLDLSPKGEKQYHSALIAVFGFVIS